MMGGSCSRYQDHPGEGNPGDRRRRPRQRRSQRQRERRSGGEEGVGAVGGGSSRRRFRSRSLPRSLTHTVGRLCGGSEDETSSDESTSVKETTKRAARHSVDAEVPDWSIAHLYPVEDNYEIHPNNTTLRRPKPLADLCVEALCRSLPNLDGELPANLPPDVVDRIVRSLAGKGALNRTTIGALRRCELGALSLANCRGVCDEWLAPLGGGSDRNRSSSEDDVLKGRIRSDSSASYDPHGGYSSLPPSPSLRAAQLQLLQSCSSSSLMMDIDDYEVSQSGNLSPADPRESQGQEDSMEDSSRSTSSFLSASSRPASPLLPSVLPPPEFFSMKWSPPVGSPSSTSLPYPMSLSNINDELALPLMPRKLPPPPLEIPMRTEKKRISQDNSFRGDDTSYYDDPPGLAPSISFGSAATSSLALLDLRSSPRLTDRGLLHLSSSAPLCSLEVAKLDGCHGIVGRGLLAFSRSTKLRTLSLAKCRRLTDEAVVNIGHLGGLTALNLDGCRCLTDRSMEALGGLTRLRQLDLSQCDLITDEGLINLNDLEELEELSLGWCRLVSDDGLEILAGQPNRPQTLRTLRLARCSLTDDGLVHLQVLESLEELDLNGCVGISSAALGDTCEKLLRLTSLDVSYCPSILRSSWQGKINSLKSLELCYSGVRDSHLARLRKLPSLEELNLDSCVVSDWGIAHLVDNEVMPNLISLDLADTDISDAAMSKIAQFKYMRHLSLFYCNISNRGLRHIALMRNLESLNLDSRDIGDEGLRCLRGLPSLKSLDLFSSRVTDLGCAYLSKIKTLTSLELCGGGIGDLGCAHLATLYNLESLNLSQNESITNRGAASLAALTNLKALNLSNTCVNPDALKFFGDLMKLQSLALYGCRDMENNPRLNALQSELPSLRCLRLNGSTNEDGVIDHNNESKDEEVEEEEEEGEDDEDGDAYYEELFEDASQEIGHEHDEPLGNAEESLASSEGGSIFEDANTDEVQSVDTSQSEDMDYDM